MDPTPSGPLKCVPFWPRISSPERRPKREGRRRRWFSKRLELVLEIRCSWWPRDAQEIAAGRRTGWDIKAGAQSSTSWAGWFFWKIRNWHLKICFEVFGDLHRLCDHHFEGRSRLLFTQQGDATKETTTLINDLVNMAWSYRNPWEECSDDVFSMPQLVRALSLY